MNAIQPIPMKYRVPEVAFPKGWYTIAESDEIGAGTLLPVNWLDQQLVVYRLPDGKAQIADAYCPHLGAHLASHDGCISEGKITCPFHKWQFDGASGRITDIPYTDVMPPSSVKLTLHPTREIEGMVMMWHHPQGAAPDFEPFDTTALRGNHAWHLYEVKTWETTCPFRDILENLFDTAHIQQLHHAAEMPGIKSLETTPYGLRVDYDLDKPGNEFPLKRMECNFTGVTQLTQLFEGDFFATLFIHSFTPVDNERFIQKSRLYMREMPDPAMYDMIGKPWLARFVSEVEQDLNVLNFKKHLPQPKLCAGDGPIMRFREYAQQYYA